MTDSNELPKYFGGRLAAALGREWRFLRNHDNGNGAIGTATMEISYTANWRDKGSVTFRIDAPNHLKDFYHRHYDARSPEINVSRKKDMAQMAAEINRRLIPMVAEDVSKAIRNKKASDERDDALARRILAVRSVCPPDAQIDNESLSFRTNDIGLAIDFGDTEVEITVKDVPNELATALVFVIREAIEHPSPEIQAIINKRMEA